MAGSRVGRPYRQGDLDQLCGVYCVVNAVRLAARPYCRLGRAACQALFSVLVGELDQLSQLQKVVTAGMGARLIVRLLRRAGQWLQDEQQLVLAVIKPFRKADEPQHCREALATHLVLPGTAAIVGTAEHWSVARAVGRKRLHLFDSSGRKRFRVEAAFGVDGKQGRNRLVLPSTLLLRVMPSAA